MTMICNLTGAIINTILDAFFVMVLKMGMQGAALATVIGQVISALIVVIYMTRYKTVSLQKKHFGVKWKYTKRIISIGTASFLISLL